VDTRLLASYSSSEATGSARGREAEAIVAFVVVGAVVDSVAARVPVASCKDRIHGSLVALSVVRFATVK
jgi:hypothetical protein